MCTQSQRNRYWHWFVSLLLLAFVAAFCFALSQGRKSNQQDRLVGTWINGNQDSVLHFRPDGTLRYRSPGHTRIAFASWEMEGSVLTFDFSGATALQALLMRLASDPSPTESYQILDVSDESITLATTSGERTLIRHEDDEIENAP
jgi:hypothetical protein